MHKFINKLSPTHGIVHAGFRGMQALVARKKSWCKLIGNRFVIPHDTIPSNVICNCMPKLKIIMNKKNEKLLLACKEGQIKKVLSYLRKTIFSKPADIDFKDVDWHNFTPLHYCLSFDYRNDEIAKLLIHKGANVNAKDEFGATALLLASYLGNNQEIIELLLNKGADVNAGDKWGDTPLTYASAYSNKEVIELLIEKGADVNVKNEKGETPLIIASEKNSCAVIKLLIDKGAHINIEGKNGDNPLINACKKGIIEIVEVLINAGADINIINSNHKTPLVVAWENHQFVLAELLIQKGSDYNFLMKQLLSEVSKQEGSASGSESAVKELILFSEIIKKHGLRAVPISLKPLKKSLERMEWACINAFDEDGSGREIVSSTAKIIRDAISTLENNPALTIIKDN